MELYQLENSGFLPSNFKMNCNRRKDPRHSSVIVNKEPYETSHKISMDISHHPENKKNVESKFTINNQEVHEMVDQQVMAAHKQNAEKVCTCFYHLFHRRLKMQPKV